MYLRNPCWKTSFFVQCPEGNPLKFFLQISHENGLKHGFLDTLTNTSLGIIYEALCINKGLCDKVHFFISLFQMYISTSQGWFPGHS